jgi:serine/threonine protein kinase
MKKPSLFGKYLLLERLNVGGMAEVFAAKAFGVEGFERILAIKKILPTMAEDEEFITMFIDEARISVQLNHANVVHIHELGKHDDAYYIAMEYVAGKDLRALLERFRRRKELMPTAMAVFVATKICEGLDYAHRKRDARGQELHIIHRDVSPQNILISYEGEVKIIDFGIAKAANRSQKTQAGILKGKFGYMSPEQVRGLPIDRRSDIFAVGVILYEMLTGEKLFVGESDFSTLEKVRNAEVPAPRQFNPNIPSGLEKVVLKALAREVEDRYQWASDLQEDLMRFLLAGDAIYSAKHLAAFMKDAFAEDLLREAEKMERFAAVERPEQVEPSGVVASPQSAPPPRRTTTQNPGALAALSGGAAAGRPRASQSMAVAAGSGAVATGMQAPGLHIPPPTEEELAEMDRGGDRTMIVDSSNPEGNDLQTAIGISPFAGGQGLDPTAPSGRQLRPSAPTSNSTTQDNLPTAGGRNGGGPRSLRELPADETIAPQSRASLPEDTGSHDLRPIEMTGFRPALEVGAEESTGPQNTPEQLEETILPRSGKPKIVIGDAPVGGATSIGPSPYAGNETRMFPSDGEDEQAADDEEQASAEADEEAYDEHADDEVQAEDAEAPPSVSDETIEPRSRRPAPERRPTPRPAASQKAARGPAAPAATVDVKRKTLLIAIAATGVLAVLVLGVAAWRFANAGPKSGVVVRVTPRDVGFTVLINPGQRSAVSPAEPIELAPGDYTIEIKPEDPAYLPVKKRISLKPGKTEPVAVVFSKAEGAPEPPREPEKPAAPPEPAAPTTWTAVISSAEPGVEIALQGKRVGTTPRVELPDLEVGKTYEFTATKSGFEPLAFTLSNTEKAPRVEKSLSLVKVAKVEPPPKPPAEQPTPKTEPKPVIAKTEPKPVVVKPEPVAKSEPSPKPPPRGKATGRAAFASIPVGAEVWIDGKSTGKKTNIPQAQALELPVGKHKVVFKLDGKSSAPVEFEITEEHKEKALVVRGNIP